MPLQNRVTPLAELEAVPERGTLFGNRGGRIHDPETRTLLKRRWASRRWIVCVLSFKQRQRNVWGHSYTELFFADEVTALAAGHRPCFECRRQDAKAYDQALRRSEAYAGIGKGADALDLVLHAERLTPLHARPVCKDPKDWPEGTVFSNGDRCWTHWENQFWQWSHAGWNEAAPPDLPLKVATPMISVAALRNGFRPSFQPAS